MSTDLADDSELGGRQHHLLEAHHLGVIEHRMVEHLQNSSGGTPVVSRRIPQPFTFSGELSGGKGGGVPSDGAL